MRERERGRKEERNGERRYVKDREEDERVIGAED